MAVWDEEPAEATMPQVLSISDIYLVLSQAAAQGMMNVDDVSQIEDPKT